MDAILEQITTFAAELTWSRIPDAVVTAAKERLADSIACAIGALDSDTARIAREVAALAANSEYTGRMIGSEAPLTADSASFVNTCLIRNLDFNDTYPGGHPSDSLGAILALAPQFKVSGRDLIVATVVAYETFIRIQKSAHLRERGWDQGFGIGVGAAAGLGSLLGMNHDSIRDAIAITATSTVPLRATRAGQLSMWKGAATAFAVRSAVFATQLARRGMTGPEEPFTGRHGFIEQVAPDMHFAPFGYQRADFYLPSAKIKYWPVVYNMQALVWAGIQLRTELNVEDLLEVEVSTYWSAWHESGSEAAKWDPRTRETADHSLPYILAWTLLHGQIDERAFRPESYLDPAIRPLMARIKARIDDTIEHDFPEVIRMHVVARTRGGGRHEVTITNPLGHENNPASTADLDAKFHRLCDGVLGAEPCAEALEYWMSLEVAESATEALDKLVVGASALQVSAPRCPESRREAAEDTDAALTN